MITGIAMQIVSKRNEVLSAFSDLPKKFFKKVLILIAFLFRLVMITMTWIRILVNHW